MRICMKTKVAVLVVVWAPAAITVHGRHRKLGKLFKRVEYPGGILSGGAKLWQPVSLPEETLQPFREYPQTTVLNLSPIGRRCSQFLLHSLHRLELRVTSGVLRASCELLCVVSSFRE